MKPLQYLAVLNIEMDKRTTSEKVSYMKIKFWHIWVHFGHKMY